MISQTSLDSFLMLQAEGQLEANERIVLDLWEKHPEGLTNFEAKELLGWDVNRVTPRRNSLTKKGRLFVIGKKFNKKTGKPNEILVASVHRHLYEDDLL